MKVLKRICWFIAITFLLISTGIIITQVFLRYILGIGIAWYAELAKFSMIYTIFIGAGLVIIEDEHPSVDILKEFIPGKWLNVIEIIFDIIIICFLVILFKEGWKIAINSTGLTTSLRIKWTYPYLAIPLGSLVMIIFSADRLKDKICKLLNNGEGE